MAAWAAPTVLSAAPTALIAAPTALTAELTANREEGVEAGLGARLLEREETGGRLDGWELRVRNGLGGYWKVGHPTLLQIEVVGPESLKGYVRIHTVDGDGVPVAYGDWPIAVEAGVASRLEAYAQHGRGLEAIEVSVWGADDTLKFRRALTDEERGVMLPATQPWIINVGQDLKLDQIAMRSGTSQLSSFTTSVVESMEGLPGSESGYAGAMLVVMGAGRVEGYSGMTEGQQRALTNWVEHGGRMVVTVGGATARLPEDSWIRGLLPGKILETLQGVDPGPLESWVNSSIPLSPLEAVRMDPRQATVDLTAMTRNREPFPLVMRHAMGFGLVTVLAVDLESPEIQVWEDRKALLEKLMGKQSRPTEGGKTFTLGFSDLSGQLRGMLDYFEGVQSASLTSLSFLVVLFLLLVGPIDYFVFTVWLQRPKWTWVTLGIVSLGMCGAIGYYQGQWKPLVAMHNTLEVMDIDAERGIAQGHAWVHLYAGVEGVYDVESASRPLGEASFTSGEHRLDWMGMPGSGLGGFESGLSADRGMPSYRIDGLGGEGGRIHQVGIQKASTKPLQVEWRGEWKGGKGDGREVQRFKVSKGSDLLEGKWRNDLGFDLLDGSLMYRNWQYGMPTRVVKDQELEFTTLSEPKDLARRLQLRMVVAGKERGVPWDPENRTALNRMMNMLLFYQAAGGESYVHLEHRYWSHLDFSELLKMDRAVIMGRVAEPLQVLKVTGGAGEVEVLENQRQSWVRIVLPVEVENRKKGAGDVSGL